MTTTHEEYWEVDGVDIGNYAFNIKTLGGRSGVPPLRGDNYPVAYHRGKRYRTKVADERTLTLAMWVIGAEENGTIPATDTLRRAAFNENWRKLQRMFFKEGTIQLTKRLRFDAGVLSATATAELVGTMEPDFSQRLTAHFVVDLLLNDPFFYAPTTTVALTVGGTVAHTMPG